MSVYCCARFVRSRSSRSQANRERLCDYIEATLGLTVNRHALIDVQVKRIHEYSTLRATMTR
ncbi:hypothetical protein EPN29_14245 [bacterium]|nr:MAG: hypothetical protein EPN29_14245 [bacterium]